MGDFEAVFVELGLGLLILRVQEDVATPAITLFGAKPINRRTLVMLASPVRICEASCVTADS